MDDIDGWMDDIDVLIGGWMHDIDGWIDGLIDG